MLKQSKQLALRTLKACWLFTLVHNSKWRQGRLLILAYHGISLEDEDQCDPALFMSPQLFRERMRLLKKHRCTLLPLNEAIQRLYADDLPEMLHPPRHRRGISRRIAEPAIDCRLRQGDIGGAPSRREGRA